MQAIKRFGKLLAVVWVVACSGKTIDGQTIDETVKLQGVLEFVEHDLHPNPTHVASFEEPPSGSLQFFDPLDYFDEADPTCIRPSSPGRFLIGARGAFEFNPTGNREVWIEKTLSSGGARRVGRTFGAKAETNGQTAWQIFAELEDVEAGECVRVKARHNAIDNDEQPTAIWFRVATIWMAKQ